MVLGNRMTTTRRIGSEAYADYLNDILTAKFYDWQLPCEDDPLREAQRGGQVLWRSSPAEEPDPWEKLIAAVASMAAKDYVTFFRTGAVHACRDVEQFFVDNEFVWPVFEHLQRLLRWADGDDYRLDRVERMIRVTF